MTAPLARGVIIRRSGLGAPLAGPAPVAARPPGVPPKATAPSALPEHGAGAATSGTGRLPATGGPELPLAALRARPATDEGNGSAPTSGTTEPVHQPRGEPAPEHGGPNGPARDAGGRDAVRPILAHDPIVPVLLAVPGATARAGAAGSPSPQVPPTAGAATGGHRGRATEGAPAGALDGPATEPTGPRRRAWTVTAAPGHDGPGVPGTAPLLARSRGTASAPPEPGADADALPEAPVPIRQAAHVDRGLAGPLAAHPRSDAGPEPLRGATSAIVPAHAARSAPASSPSGIAVQRAVQVEDVSGQVTGAAAEGAAAGSGGAAGIAAASDGELDLLARRLFERLRGRLATELLLDRERSGSLADL